MIRCSKCNGMPNEHDIIGWKCNSCGKAFQVTKEQLYSLLVKKETSPGKSFFKCPSCGGILDDGNESIAWKCSCGHVAMGKLMDFEEAGEVEEKEEVIEVVSNIPKGHLINCPECGKEISSKAKKCVHCGKVFVEEKRLTKLCDDCGKEVAVDSTECPFCGCPLKRHKIPKKSKKMVISIAVAICCILFGTACTVINAMPSVKYDKAEKAFLKGNYEKAIKYYTALGDYEDATEKLEKTIIVNHYIKGKRMIEKENYDGAIEELSQVENYKDSDELIKQCHYYKGLYFLEQGGNVAAALEFGNANDYEDANDQVISIGEHFVKEGNFVDAITVFNCATNSSKNSYFQYATGMINIANKNYKDAMSNFEKAGDVLEASELYKETAYNYATSQMTEKQYNNAIVYLVKISDYKDSNNLLKACKLMNAKSKMDTGNLMQAKKELETLPEDFSYNNVQVSGLLNKLNENINWVNICGKWNSKSGKAASDCTSRTTGRDMGTWSNEIIENACSLDIKCILNEDGTVNVTGSGSIFVFENWSTLKIGLDYNTSYPVSFNKKVNAVSDFGTAVEINDIITITFGKEKISLKYKKNDDNSSANFTYCYTTSIEYIK